jgi:uroporphyrinogen decarboxylase
MIQSLLDETEASGGLAPVNLKQFWDDQAVAIRDPFSAEIPQLPLGVMMSDECVWDELGVPEDWWRQAQDEPWRLSLNKAYNERAEEIVGRPLLNERPSNPDTRYPGTGGLHDIFEAHNTWVSGSWWLEQSAHNEDELQALLDRVESRDVRSTVLSDEWLRARDRLLPQGIRPGLYRGQRGPVTFATSIYGVENFVYLVMDNPDLAGRLRDAILSSMLELARVLDEEAGFTPETAPHGFGFADDNCYLLSPKLYEFFAYPVLDGIFKRYSPNPGDSRFQHSDSAMGHLVPTLARLGLTGVNFGPKVTAAEIRRHMPWAIIYGQLAPFTFSRDDRAVILAELLRDFEATRESRGLVFATAGSINNGSRLAGMRLIMAGIQRYARY